MTHESGTVRSSTNNNHKQGMDVLNLDEILDKLKLSERCKSPSLRQKLTDLVTMYQDRFAVNVGSTPAAISPFEIEVDESEWLQLKSEKYPRPQSAAREQAIRKFIRKAIADKVIRPSQASYFSQVLLTPKANGSWRFCVDYRNLNRITKRSGWTIPNIEGLLRKVGSHKAKYYASLDYTSGYHQAPLAESSRQYTAFVTTEGVFEWCRVPMGPLAAPGYFQRQMQTVVFPDMIFDILVLYLDDLLTWSKGEDENSLITHLTQIFERARKFNITFNPEKCKLGLEEIEYLGHVINSEGLSYSKEKTNKVENFRLPETQKSLKSFIGLASYFRDHIKDFTILTQPIQDLITPYRPRQRIKWTDVLMKCFRDTQDAIINCPKLYFLREGDPVFVQTDASDYGIGAYLYQLHTDPDTGEKSEKPIGFISKSLTKSQRRWSTTEKEAYAIYYSLMKWDHHLRDIHFTILTDHKNLTYINIAGKQKVQRWKLAIQDFDFDLIHIKGEDNKVGDPLSRLCKFSEDFETETQKINENMSTFEQMFQDEINEIKKENDITDHSCILLTEEIRDLLDEEVNDSHLSEEIQNLIGMVHNSTVQEGTKIGIAGHGGVEVTLRRLYNLIDENPKFENFKTWENMRHDVRTFIRKCPCCQKMAKLKIPIQTRPFTTSAYGIWDCIAIDTIGPLPESPLGHKYILTVIDKFSRFIELIAISDQKAIPAAEALIQIIGRYGMQAAIGSDNSTQFANKVVTELLKIMDVQHSTIHPYSHEKNAHVENANKEVLRHLKNIMFDARIMADWYKYLPFVQRIKNSEVCKSTGVTPSELIFGHNIDLNRGIITPYREPHKNLSEFVASNIKYQHIAIEVALETQRKTNMYHIKSSISKKRKKAETVFEINSYVLVQYENREGIRPHAAPTKLHSNLRGPFKVISKTYRNGKGTIYTCQHLATNKLEDFHVTNLQPFNYDPQRVNPIDVALRDNENFLIDKVIKHRFINNKAQIKSNLEFLIKFIGEDKESWEPWKNVSKLEKVHQYCKLDKNLTKFVPK